MQDDPIVFTDEALFVRALEAQERTRRWVLVTMIAALPLMGVGIAFANAFSGSC